MAAARLWRVFLAAAVVVAMQSSLLHPFEHFHAALGSGTVASDSARTVASDPAVKAIGDREPLETLDAKLCELCVAGAALGVAVPASSSAEPVFSSGGLAVWRDEGLFLAAFTPFFRSQAPPVLL